MAFIFDGNGDIAIPEWTATDGFLISGTCTAPSSAQNRIIIADSDTGNHFIGFVGAVFRARINNVSGDVAITSASQEVIWSVERATGSSSVTFTVNGTPLVFTSGGTLNLDSIGSYNGGQLVFNSSMSGILHMEEDSSADRDYNFSQPIGTTNLPDDTSAQHGVFSGFTTGDYDGLGGSPTEEIAITSIVDNQFYQKVSGQKVVTVSGAMTNVSPAPASIEYSFDGSTWLELDGSPTTSAFSGTVTLVGQSDIFVRLSDDTGITDSKTDNSALDYYIVAGQSNASGRGLNNQTYTQIAGLDAFEIDLSGAYSKMTDPTGTDGIAVGSVWPLWAQHNLNAGNAVAVGNVAVGGTAISEWQTGGANFTNIIDAYNFVGDAKEVLFCQGTSDAGGNMVTYAGLLSDMVDDIFSQIGLQTRIIFPPQASAAMDLVRAAQQTVIDSNANAIFGGDWSAIDITVGVGADNVHLKTDAHLVQAASIHYDSYSVSVGAGSSTSPFNRGILQ